MIKEMNKKIFKDNLLLAIEKLKEIKGINTKKYRFIIQPIEERGKKLNTKDNYMRLGVLTEENIGGKLLRIDNAVDVLGGLEPLVPLWINVSFVEIIDDDTAVFRLDCSMRLRKPTLLKNAETGHPHLLYLFKLYKALPFSINSLI